MYDLRALPSVKHLRAYGAVLFGLVFAFQVNAAPFTSTSSGNSVTFTASSYDGGSALTSAALALSAGAVYASQPATIRTAAGVVAPLVVRAAPAAGAIASTVLTCLGNPLCVVATGAVAAVVANELYYSYSVSGGVPIVTSTPQYPQYCYSAPCYKWPLQSGGFTENKLTAAQTVCGYLLADYNACNYTISGSVMTIYANNASNNQQTTTRQGQSGGAVLTPTVTPSTKEALAAAIGAKTDWAPNSKITDLLEQIVKNTSQAIPLQAPTITGPTQVVSTPTVQTKADGSKTTSTTKTNFGYYGPTATATTVIEEKQTTVGGVTTVTSTTDGAPAYVEEKPKTDEYDLPSGDIPKTTKTITFSAENLGFAGGSCPSNVNQLLAGKTVKIIDWTSNCSYVTTYAKPMILALATFAALMIIFVGKPE
jgi:hypothetical protein